MEERPNYYAIIPANVRYDEELQFSEKMLYGEITALTQKTGECWASNNYFAKLYKVTPQAISKWVKKLEQQQYIKISYVYKNNTKEIEKRIIQMVSTPIDRYQPEIKGGINSSLEGYQLQIKDNNTSTNNTSINNNIFDFIEESYGRGLTPIELEEIDSWKQYHTEEEIKEAIKESCLNNVKKINYTKAILNNWRINGKEKVRQTPDWYGKDIEEDIATAEEIEELERMINHGCK